MTRGLTLNLETQTQFIPNVTDGFRIKITATDPVEMDENIFRYRQAPVNLNGDILAECVGVCTVPEYEGLPIGAPDAEDPERLFRLDYVDQVFATRDIALIGWHVYQQEVELLVESLMRADQLTDPVEVRIGVENGGGE